MHLPDFQYLLTRSSRSMYILLVKLEVVKITVPMQKPSMGCLVSDVTDNIATESNQLVSGSPVSFFTPRMIKTVITQLTRRVIVVHVSTLTRPNNSYSNRFQLDVLFHCCSTNICLFFKTMLEIGYRFMRFGLLQS